VGVQRLVNRFHLGSGNVLQPTLRVGPLLLITANCFLATSIPHILTRTELFAIGVDCWREKELSARRKAALCRYR
jgi:hypothetical protein